jgi:putative transposase
MATRQNPFVSGCFYHVFNKSIAGFSIFNSEDDYRRMRQALQFFSEPSPYPLSLMLRNRKQTHLPNQGVNNDRKLATIVAYCLMPTHYHLLLRQNEEDGISKFINDTQNSYTKYFNLKYNRKGPLWEGVFKDKLLKNDEIALHVSRYIHLNPVTAYLVNKPEEWISSSYHHYCGLNGGYDVDVQRLPDIEPSRYRDFVENRIDYQRKLSRIQDLVLE